MQKGENFKEKKNKRTEFIGRIYKSLREKDERKVRKRLSHLVRFAFDASAGCLLSLAQLFFSTYPLSAALALSGRGHLFGLASGVVLSLFLGLPVKYLFGFAAVLLFRILCTLLPAVWKELSPKENKDEKELIPFKTDEVAENDAFVDESNEKSPFSLIFCENLYIKLLCGMFGGFVCGLLLLIERDFSFYSLFGALVLILGVPIIWLLIQGHFGENRDEKKHMRIVSLCAISFFCVLGGGGRTLLGMPMQPFLSMLLTLYSASVYGVIVGILTALVTAFAFNSLYIPLLLLSALLLISVGSVKKNAGVAAVCGVVVIYCYYIGGEQGLISVLPPMLLSLPVYMLADKYREMMASPYRYEASLTEGVYFAEAVAEKNKNEAAKDRLASLSEAFTSLSENFYKISDRFRRPNILGLKKLADEAFERTCEGCRNREICWGNAYSDTLEALRALTSCLQKKGTAREEDLSEAFREQCLKCSEMIRNVNSEVTIATERMIKAGKASFFADNYDDITAILDSALESDPEEYECDGEKGSLVFDYLYSQGFEPGGIAVYGKRCRHIIARKLGGAEGIDADKGREISRRIGEIVGEELSDPIFELGKDGMSMMIYSKPKIKAICSHGCLCGSEGEKRENRDKEEIDLFGEGENESICGDVTEVFITDNSYFYSLISDGMGSGEEAGYIANVSAMFIEKMLCAGNRADVTLRMLNNVIRSENMGCGSECSATVDLLELDLMNGKASFIKSGAAPTYIARDGTVYKISSRTMPIGIIKDADARITKFDTKKGDIIVMISDGCCHDSDDCPWLVEYLCEYMSNKRRVHNVGEELSETMKNEILKEAVKNFPTDKERDDISVSVIVVG